MKDLFSYILFRLGVSSALNFLVKRLYREKTVIILEYHRIIDALDEFLALGMGGSFISTKQFAEQVGFLKRRFSVVPLEWLTNQIDEKNYQDIPDYSVVITFDDGYRDNYDNAFPILKEYDIPATIFLISDNIDSDRLMWLHLLYYIAYKTNIDDLESCFSSISGFKSKDIYIKSGIRYACGKINEEKTVLIKKIKFFLNHHIPYKERAMLVRNLADQLYVNDERRIARNLYLSRNQINEMEKYRISFGAHTKTHPLLSTISQEEAKEEIIESKSTIESLIGKKIFSFAYPFGENCSRTPVREILDKEGFICACTSNFGTNQLDGDLFSLKRKGRAYSNIGVFAAEMFGIYDLLRKLIKK